MEWKKRERKRDKQTIQNRRRERAETERSVREKLQKSRQEMMMTWASTVAKENDKKCLNPENMLVLTGFMAGLSAGH